MFSFYSFDRAYWTPFFSEACTFYTLVCVIFFCIQLAFYFISSLCQASSNSVAADHVEELQSDRDEEKKLTMAADPSQVFPPHRADEDEEDVLSLGPYERYRYLKNDEEILQQLQVLDSWNFDVFGLHDRVGDLLLPLLGITMIFVLEIDMVSEHALFDYFYQLSLSYRSQQDVPYHNVIHVADVMSTLYSYLKAEDCNFTKEEKLALICGTAAHDVGHCGVNNDFHVKTFSELATVYLLHIALRLYKCERLIVRFMCK